MPDMDFTDPLQILPPEVVLRVIHHLDLQVIGRLQSVSTSWHTLISIHQDTIYFAHNKIRRPAHAKDLSFLPTTLTNYYDTTSGWKDASRRQHLLLKNWSAPVPSITTELIHTPVSFLFDHGISIWRFRIDLRRRICLATTDSLGLYAFSLQTRRHLWTSNHVRAYSHLEYEDGIAVTDHDAGLTIWNYDESAPGSFHRIANIHLDRIRGFQLHHRQLCVITDTQTAHLYDLHPQPSLLREIAIASDVVGHLFQTDDHLVYSTAQLFRFVDKATGQHINTLCPDHCRRRLHVRHDREGPETNRLTLAPGPLLPHLYPVGGWGPAVLHGDIMIAFAGQGLLFYCCDWARLLSHGDWDSTSLVIETQADPRDWDGGGWLSTDGHRAIFEVSDSIYVLDLPRDGGLPSAGQSVLVLKKGDSAATQQPVSYMQVFEDGIAATYNVRYESLSSADQRLHTNPVAEAKMIRILSFAPDLGSS